jgi:hypothetical protein
MPTPNTVVKILKGIELDRDLENTYRFASLSAQQNFFSSPKRVKFQLENLQYLRTGENSIKVEKDTASLYDCNYLMFQNTGYMDASGRTRWFYAFIDRVDYVNEATSEIFYTIDPMQTWLFDFKFAACMIEREHVRDDTIGANIVAEPVTAGQYIKVVEASQPFNSYRAMLVLSKPFPIDTTLTASKKFDVTTAKIKISSEVSVDFSFRTPTPMAGFSSPYNKDIVLKECFESTSNGILPTNFSWYADVPCSNVSSTGDFSTSNEMLDLAGDEKKYYSINTLLTWIANGNIQGLTADDIVCVLIYPDFFTNGTHASTGIRGGFGKKEVEYVLETSQPFRGKRVYAPKNNKLFTSPFTRLIASNKAGVQAEYRPEWFSNPFKPTFTMYFYLSGTPTCCLYPLGYMGEGKIENAVTACYDMEIPYKGNAYAEYIRANRGKLVSSALNSVVSAGAAVAVGKFGGSVLTGSTVETMKETARNPATGRQVTTGTLRQTRTETTTQKGGAGEQIRAGAGGLSSMIDIVGTLYDLHQAPAPVYGNMTAADIMAQLKQNDIVVYRESIDSETAETIDNFFTYYGYAVKKVKQPGVYNRHYWQYIKTCGCNLHNADGYSDHVNVNVNYSTGMSAADMETLEKIFDRGITLWNQDVQIGDYTLDNGTLTSIALSDAALFDGNPRADTPLANSTRAIRLYYSDDGGKVETVLPGDRSVSWEVKTGVSDDSYVKADKVVEGTHFYRVRIADLVSEGKEITSA